MPKIRELVARRTDLSTFLVHLTRDTEDCSSDDALEKIIRGGVLKAVSGFGPAAQPLAAGGASERDQRSQRCVCFTETPLEHLHLLLEPISDMKRKCVFRPYGVAITKRMGRAAGVNPVWYVDITPGHDWIMVPINALISEAVAAGGFRESHIAKIAPFIEQMGTQPGRYRKEFWWEREWRHVGNLRLPDHFIGIAPEDEHGDWQELAEEEGYTASFVDPDWGLEEIIARLAGFDSDEVGPFDG